MTLLLLLACHSGVDSLREAELAYIGFDEGVSRALDLGLQGFSMADSANLETQTGAGDEAGVMSVDGQADQGNSDNKGLRLTVTLVGYADLTDVDVDGGDDLRILYDTDAGAPLSVDLTLHDMPDGTLSGTVAGDLYMSDGLEGPASFALALDGLTEADPDHADHLRRVAGSTHVTGSVTGPAGAVYDVDLVR